MTREPRQDDIEREIEFQIQETVDALVAEGMPEAQARTEAARRFGDRRQHAHAMLAAHPSHDSLMQRGWRTMADVLSEARLALRTLRRSPGYALTAILTLALVSGANLTMFGIADGLTFRPLAYMRAPDDVNRVYWKWTERGRDITSASTQYPRFLDFVRDGQAFADVAVFAERTVPVGTGAEVRQRPIAAVSASYFRFFDAAPERGRFFAESEDLTPRGTDVAVLGYGHWRATYGGRDVIGRQLQIGDINATIIGVAPKGFDGLNDGRPPAAFVPITTYAASTGTTDARTYFTAYKWGWVHLLVRRSPNVSPEAAEADATRIFASSWPRFVSDNPNMPPAETARPQALLSSVRPGAGPTAGPESRTALWLLGVAGAVLLIGCANVANLSLARALTRREEVEVRRALGASDSRLLASVVAEAAWLAAGAAITALVVSQTLWLALAPVLRSLRLPQVSVFTDPRTLLVTMSLAVVCATITAIIPALRLKRGGSLAHARLRGATADGRHTRGLLLAGQSMLSVTLLIGAGLFIRSLINVQHAPLGYNPERVFILGRTIPAGGFDAAQQIALRNDLLAAATALPDVEAAAWVSSAPFVSTSSTDLHVPGIDDATALGPFTFQATTVDFFRVMGTRILKGRGLEAQDSVGAPEIAVVSESMARVLWPGEEAIGRCLRMRTTDSPCRTVVGIAEDIVQRDLADGPRLHYYVPIEQYPRTFGNGLVVRLRADSAQTADRVLSALQDRMPGGSYLSAQSLATVVGDQRSSWRLGAVVMSAFGALALVVAGVGLFGAVTYDITQRSREWGIRSALGADRASIVVMVLRRSVAVVVAGLIPGLVIAVSLAPRIESLLYRTSPRDPAVFAAATVVLLLVAAIAGLRPSLKAARVSPIDALRETS